MKVLQLHSGYRVPAGEDAVVAAEAAMLRERGHEVVQLRPPNPSDPLGATWALARSVHNASRAREVRDLVHRERPDVAHVHNTWFSLSTSVLDALAACGVPVVATMHNYRLGCIGTDLFRDGDVCTACVGCTPWAGVRHRCYKGSLPLSAVAALEVGVHRRRGTWSRSVERFIAPTAFARDRLVEIGLPEERLVVKPHFVGDPGPRRRPASDSRDVIFVGRLAPGKGLEVLLRAAHRLADEPLRIVVIGDGPLRRDLIEAAPRGTTFVPWEDHAAVVDRMLGARALVFPSEWFEPFGMVLLEALSCGLPIVASDVSAVAAIVDPDPRLLVPAGDDAALAAALAHLVDDDLVDVLGARSRERYYTHFTPAANGPLLESIYADAIAGAATRGRG